MSQPQGNVCVGTIIDEHDAFNNNNANPQQNGVNVSNNINHVMTMQSNLFQQPQHAVAPMNAHQHQHHPYLHQQQVIYATNPRTGETVVFPMIPAASLANAGMQNSPLHFINSPHQQQQQQPQFGTANNTNTNNINSNQLTAFPEPNSVYWTTGLFDCSHDVPGCVESWFCNRCQLARQYSHLQHGTTEIDPIAFIASVVLDALAAPAGIWALAWHTRRGVRRRYGIVGNDCSDCVTVALCGPCAAHQAYRELSVHGSWPTGCCIDQPYALPAERRFASPVVVTASPNPILVMTQDSSNNSNNNNNQVRQGQVQNSNNNNTVSGEINMYPIQQLQHQQQQESGTSMM